MRLTAIFAMAVINDEWLGAGRFTLGKSQNGRPLVDHIESTGMWLSGTQA